MRIKTEGAWSRHLVPVYPTMSLPNHTSFATGCWPEHHGVVQNKFFDPDRGVPYDENGDADWLKGCEPMWQAAERQGVKAAALNFANRWNVKKKVALASVINPFVPWEETPSDEQTLVRGLELVEEQRCEAAAVDRALFSRTRSRGACQRRDLAAGAGRGAQGGCDRGPVDGGHQGVAGGRVRRR